MGEQLAAVLVWTGGFLLALALFTWLQRKIDKRKEPHNGP
jgi:hypothetical protein